MTKALRATRAQLERSIKAATVIGLSVSRMEHFPDGRVVLHFAPAGDVKEPATVAANEWDAVL